MIYIQFHLLFSLVALIATYLYYKQVNFIQFILILVVPFTVLFVIVKRHLI